MTELFDRRLRGAARALPAPPASDDLMQRVLAERERGSRITLPTGARMSSPIRARSLSLIAVAAAVLIVALWVTSRAVPRSTASKPAHPSSRIEELFASSGAFLSTAYAQTPPAAPGAPPLTGLNGLAIGKRRLEYRLQSVDTLGRVTPEGGGLLRIIDAQYEGKPAWRVERTGQIVADDGQKRLESETLYVTRRDLRLLARVIHQAPFSHYSQITIRQRFAGDSVTGEMTTDDGIRRPIARALPAAFGPYLSDAMAPAALIGVDLSPGWKASLSIVGWAVVPNDVFFPVTLRVVGEERIATPAGAFDCWKLHISAGREQRIEWVRKSDGVALRSAQDSTPGAKSRREFVLLNP